MVDIAAQLSLTASGPAIDPAAILGAETADSQAFGNILAGQVAGGVQANPDSGAPASPLPPFPAPAGNRQPGGKILPGAAQILPDVSPLGVEAPAAQVLPTIAAIPAVRLVTTPALTKFVPQSQSQPQPQPHAPADGASDPAADASAPKHASPVHGLIKLLNAALKGQRSAARGAEDAPAAAETANPENTAAKPEMAEPAIPATAPTLAALSVILPVAVAAAPQSATSGGAIPGPGRAPIMVPITSVPKQAGGVSPEQIEPAVAQFMAQAQSPQTQPASAAAVQVQPVQVQPGQAPVGASTGAPALTVPAAAGASTPSPTPVVTLVAAPAPPVGQTVAARVKVAAAATDKGNPAVSADRAVAAQPPLTDRGVAGEAPVAAGRPVPTISTAPAIRTVLAERAATDHGAVPAAVDVQTPLTVAAPVTSAPAAPVANTGAPVVEMPRQDFAALVDRLVEARNAAAPQSTHASLNHAEFGQVSLHFQQDGGDLKVAMSSADPDFARAAQAAQAAQTPLAAERQNFADTNSRGQGQAQNHSQSANGSSHSPAETGGRDAGHSDQQGRNGQGRNPRGGNDPSNPSPRWAGRDQPQARGGIFA